MFIYGSHTVSKLYLYLFTTHTVGKLYLYIFTIYTTMFSIHSVY